MKKFLFTLTALLMAGSLCAEEYFYIPDFEVKRAELGTTIEVSVPAHFDAAVSGWEVWIEMPDGLQITYAEQGADMTITYIKANGRTGTLTAPFYFNSSEPGHYVTAVADPGYYQVDGNWVSYGSVKWLADDYDEMIYMEVSIAEDFEGGDIIIKSQCSCGNDSREDVTPCVTDNENFHPKTCHVTVEKVSNPAPAAEITNNVNVVTAAVPNDTENHTVELYIVTLDDEGNVVSRTPVVNPYTVTQTDEDQEIYFVAVTKANDGETEDTETTPTKIVIPAKPVALAVTLDPDEANAITGEKIAVAVEANKEGATFSYACEGATLTETEDGFEITATAAGTYTVTVTATVGEETATATGTYTFVEPLAVTLDPATGNAKVGQEIAVTVEANKEGATFNYACEGATVTETEDGFKITAAEAGTYKVTVTATVGEETATTEGTYTFSAITYAPEPELNWNEETNTMTVVVPEGYSVVVTGPNGTETITETKDYVIEQTDDEQSITFTAYTLKKDEDNNSAPVEETVTVHAMEELPGEIVFSEVNQENGQFTVTYVGEVEGVTLTLDDETIELLRDVTNKYQLPDYGTYPVTATASATGYKDITKDATLVWKAPKIYQTPDPTISVVTDNENQKVIITVTGEGTVTAAVENANGTTNYTDPDGDGKIVIEIPFGDNPDIVNVTATAKATTVPEGYDAISETPGTAQENGINIPAKPKQTAKPTIDVSFGGETGSHYAVVTLQNNDTDPVVYEYSFNGTDWITYNGPVTLDPSYYGDVTIYARAKAENKTWSEPSERTFTLGDDATSVNELINGKTVAGVRYFNMAGQEMQEANGITIVVTTYTDGTTSAVKVIK